MKTSSFREIVEKIDPVFKNIKRYLVVSALVVFGPMTVSSLKKVLGFSYGELDNHLRKLSEENYIKLRKIITDEGPRTLVELTEKGYKRYIEFSKVLHELYQKTFT